MLNEGVELMAGTGGLLSSAHSDGDIERTVEAFARTLGRMKAEGAL
jgi:glutamate-1-semialdehyde aminotransferase